jgi:hypothetical protein
MGKALTYFRIGADCYGAQHGRVRPDGDPFAQCRVPVTGVLPRAPYGDAVKQGTVIVNNRGLADHDSGGVVDHYSAAELSARVQIHAEGFGDGT